MTINDILKEKRMSVYALSKQSGIPQSTIRDICSGKTKLRKCSVENALKISRVLDVSVEDLASWDDESKKYSHDIFRGNSQHLLKEIGDYEYIKQLIVSDDITKYYSTKRYFEAFYLLAMLDYLSRINGIPLYKKYNKLRKCKLRQIDYPTSVIVSSAVSKNPIVKTNSVNKSIPEFIRHNIVECEVRNVV